MIKAFGGAQHNCKENKILLPMKLRIPKFNVHRFQLFYLEKGQLKLGFKRASCKSIHGFWKSDLHMSINCISTLFAGHLQVLQANLVSFAFVFFFRVLLFLPYRLTNVACDIFIRMKLLFQAFREWSFLILSSRVVDNLIFTIREDSIPHLEHRKSFHAPSSSSKNGFVLCCLCL